MPSLLALDQGTTGSTALLIHQDGTVRGRGYREFTQRYPQPGWVEHDPEEILRVSLEAMREALASSGERPAGIGITNQRETVVLWDRRTLAPLYSLMIATEPLPDAFWAQAGLGGRATFKAVIPAGMTWHHCWVTREAVGGEAAPATVLTT